MIEEDASSLRYISFLYETSYYHVAIFAQDAHLWKSYAIQEQADIKRIMPYLFCWNVHVCLNCNQLQLLFPYQCSMNMHEVYKRMKTMDAGIHYLQQLILTIQQERLTKSVSYMLCDQMNLSLNEDKNWNLYGNPRLEVLLRDSPIDESCWQHLCASVLLELVGKRYPHLPTPSIFETTIVQLKDREVINTDQLLALLGDLKGCYQGMAVLPKRYKRLLHYLSIILLMIMILMSIIFFIYEYKKAHQEYFNEIEQIGDVLVNPDE